MKNRLIIFFYFMTVLVYCQDIISNANALEFQITEFQKTGNINSVEYSNLLNNLGMIYCNEGSYNKAESLFLKALEIKKNNLGNNHPEVGNILNNLAFLYLYQNKYAKAEPLFLRALEINKETLGEKHPNYANSLNSLAMLYNDQGLYSKAEPLYLKALIIRKDIFGENSTEYATSLNNLGNLYFAEGKYSESEKLMLEALEIFKNISGKNNSKYALMLNNMAVFYVNQSKFSQAEPKFLEALEITKELSGENNLNSSSFLIGLAGLYSDQGKYDLAEAMYLKAIKIQKEILGENSIDYASSMSDLSVLYSEQGKYNDAEKIYLKVLNIKKEILGEESLSYAVTLSNLAVLYNNQARYAKAEALNKKVISIRKEILGTKHIDYAKSLSNLAQLYQEQAKYSLAEPLMLEASKIIKETLGENNLDFATSLNNLASSYQDQGKYEKAIPIYLESIGIKKEVLGEKNPDYLITLSNLATLYIDQEKYSEAEPLHIKILEIRKEILGERHPDYVNSLTNLGALYFKQNKYSLSESLSNSALKISNEIFGQKNPVYALSLANLGNLNLIQKKYSSAEPLLLKSLEIRQEILGKNHPDCITNLYDIANLYQTIYLNDQSSDYFEKFIKTNQKRMVGEIYGFTEYEQIRYINSKSNFLIYPLSFLHNFPNIYPNINTSCYENELLIKNLSLRNRERITNSIQKSGNKLLQIKYQQFLENKIKIKKLQELPLDKLPSNFKMLVEETEQIEKELSTESTSFFEYKKAIEISWNSVKTKLNKNEVLIDLIKFNYFNEKMTDNVIYSIFIVGKSYKFPKCIPLFEEKQLSILLKNNKSQQDKTRIDEQYLNKAISDLFLKPLEKELKGVTTIYLSPSGLGHQIDFAALPISDQQTLGEKFKLHILSSPAEIMDYKVAGLDKNSNLELLLYGGIDYDKSNTLTSTQTAIVANVETLKELQSRSGISEFGYLSGSKKEVEQIQLNGNKNGFKSTLLDDRNATEESIKQLDGRTTPFVLHLATHGYFFQDPEQEIPKDFDLEIEKSKIYKASDDPMLRSGLIFAGANRFWSKAVENTTTNDGILTASEISNLDLSACQLVVLSACETGLGQVKGSEGVFGLQRAFKMARVKNIIMSLWKVPDAQTAELFEIFYNECFTEKSIHESFQIAQTKMKAKYSPYYWAGFVLLE